MSTKIHVAVDALGNPVRVILTGGQVSDITQTSELIAGLDAQNILADKAYDADALIHCIESSGAEVIIPSKSNRVHPRERDKVLYKGRRPSGTFF